MPLLEVSVNVAVEGDQKKKLLKQLSDIVKNETGKPEKYVSVLLKTELDMLFSGTDDPCAICRFHCIGHVNKEYNESLSKAVCATLKEVLKIEGTRIYIFFYDYPRQNVGYDSTVF